MLNEELVNTVKDLIKNGSQFNVNELDKIYHKDLRIARWVDERRIDVIDRAENMVFFNSKRDEKAAPLSPEATFRYAHASGSVGHVVLERKMKLHDKEEHLLYNIMLKKADSRWKVVSEFIIPIN